MKTLISNKRILREYGLAEKYEAGIKLLGLEVKALKEGKGNLKGSIVKIADKKILLIGFNIPPYSRAADKNYQPTRSRILLLNKREIKKLAGFLSQKGYSAFPLRIYLKNNLIKVELGAGRKLKKYEKKREAKERQEEKDLQMCYNSSQLG